MHTYLQYIKKHVVHLFTYTLLLILMIYSYLLIFIDQMSEINNFIEDSLFSMDEEMSPEAHLLSELNIVKR